MSLDKDFLKEGFQIENFVSSSEFNSPGRNFLMGSNRDFLKGSGRNFVSINARLGLYFPH